MNLLLQYPSRSLRPLCLLPLLPCPLFFLVVQLFSQQCYATQGSFRGGKSTLHYFWAQRNPVSDVMGLIPKPSGDVPSCCNGGGNRQRSCTHQKACCVCSWSHACACELSQAPCAFFILMSASSFVPLSSSYLSSTVCTPVARSEATPLLTSPPTTTLLLHLWHKSIVGPNHCWPQQVFLF